MLVAVSVFIAVITVKVGVAVGVAEAVLVAVGVAVEEALAVGLEMTLVTCHKGLSTTKLEPGSVEVGAVVALEDSNFQAYSPSMQADIHMMETQATAIGVD